MFTDFLYLLRNNGLDVSLTEWMSFMEALKKNLHGSSFTGFYLTCRCLLVKSEADFDVFDRSFLEYFKDVDFESEIPKDLLEWLEAKDLPMGMYDELQEELNASLSPDEIESMLRERLSEQKERHDGGTYWIGTHGMSVFGNNGMSNVGIKVGGSTSFGRAMRAAGERRYRDFRKDNVLDISRLQMAFRRLRQFSTLTEISRTEFDIDNTVKDTADNAGYLKVRYKRPRVNAVKVLLLMDSGGSMNEYASLCAALFQAVTKAGHFKDLKIYYFHNCPYTRVFKTPELRLKDAVSVSGILNTLSSDYKLIFVGDAQMYPHELFSPFPSVKEGEPESGLDCLMRFKDHFKRSVWISPSDPGGRAAWGYEWTVTYERISDMFAMYPLTVDGLESAMKKLLTR